MLYLLDSSAVLNDFGFEFKPGQKYVTTPLAIAEFRDLRSRHLAENALHQGLLKILEPGPKSLELAKKRVGEKGFTKLSKTDLSILALGLDLKNQGKRFMLITDDYSIQNFCSLFQVPFEPVIRGRISGEKSFK